MKNLKESFAQNLRAKRKECALTQKVLADMLGFSEKTVSKWECGASIPDIETLFEIAGILHTNLEGLFAESKIYCLGIDGGGTKTDLALGDSEGNIIRTLKADSCNPVDIGLDAAKKILKESIYEICRDIPFSSIVFFAGIAGGTTADMQERLAEFFAGFGFREFQNDSDNKNIIAAGLGGNDGITMILGTGVCAYTQRKNSCKRTAGWGYLIDNGGSAYNIGRDALNAYFCSHDGTGGTTALTAEIDRLFPGGTNKIMGQIYSKGKKAVASFAPAVFAALEKGDKIASEIFERNMIDAAHIIETAAIELTDEKITVVLAGGLTNQPVVLETLKEKLGNPKRFELKVLDQTPVYGALNLAMKLLK